MTDDIVHRLRNPNYWLFQIVGPKSGATVQGESDAPREAADGIERLRADLCAYRKERDEEVVRLRAERDELRELLREARNFMPFYTEELRARIDAALNKGGGDEV